MEPFKIHILGCGSAHPTMRHNPSSQVVEIRGKLFMIDCGEGTQLQLRRSRIRFTKLSAIFISHLHGDHCFGLAGMLSTFGLLDRNGPIHVYAQAELKPLLDLQIQTCCHGLDYEVVFHPIDPAKRETIYEDRSLTVETLPLNHRVPCCGFIFREKPTLPHIRREMIDALGIPVSQVNNIKNGSGWTSPDGDFYDTERLTMPAEPPRAYAYCSDTKYMPQLYRQLQGVDTIYHESTYLHRDAKNAALHWHSTAKEAAMVAQKAGARKLVLGHFSARYDDERPLLDEAKAVFENSVLASEGKVIDV